ncbi:hypothetical protein BGZ76_004264, partial [Entomortierella beljakovae]
MYHSPFDTSYLTYSMMEQSQYQQQARFNYSSSHSPFTHYRNDDGSLAPNINNPLIGASGPSRFERLPSECPIPEQLRNIEEREKTGKSRTKHSIDLKNKIIQAKAATNISVTKLSKIFGVKRSTIYGILKSKELIDQNANVTSIESTQERCRLPKVGTRILDELAVSWIKSLKSQRRIELRNAVVERTGKEVQEAIQRILLNKQKLSKFTSSWVNKIIKRCGEESVHADAHIIGESLEEHIIRWFIKGYEQDDIYYCGLFGYYMEKDFETDSTKQRSSLLFSNASGLIKSAEIVKGI